MKAVPMGRHQPNSPEWDRIRSRGIGGSEIAAVVGLSPWESRFSLWHRKRGTIGKQQTNAGMDWGTRLEDVVCDAFAETRDMLDVERAGTFTHHERRWQIANPDRLLNDDEFGYVGLLEAKTASAFDAHEWGRGPEDIPPYYRCQVLWYLDVLELPTAHLAVLIGGSDYREYVIPYAPDEARWLRERGQEFWQQITNGDEPPELDGSTATYEAVRQLHPDIDGDSVEIDSEIHEQFQATKHEAEDAATRHLAAKTAVLDAMGQAKYAEVDGERVYRRQPARGGAVSLYSVPPFRADQKTLKESA